MDPFVIPVGEPIDERLPTGWAVRSLGVWRGQESLVAYDPRLHAVELSPLWRRNEESFRSFEASGLTPLVLDLRGGQILWYRDLRMATFAALDRATRPDVVEIEGLGR